MNQLGTRLLFYETPIVDFKKDDLLAYAARNDVSQAAQQCNRAVNKFVIEFFKRYRIQSVPLGSLTISRSV